MYILPQLDVKRLGYDQIGYKRLAVEISNHCRGKCWWCTAPRNDSRLRSVDELMDELSQHAHEFDSIHFMDNDLGVYPDRFLALCERLAASSLRAVPKLAKMCVVSVSPPLISAAVEAGFRIFSLGVESFNQNILDFLSKNISTAQICEVLDTLLVNGIKPGINLIMFSTPETIDSLNQTLDMALEYAQHGAYLNATGRLYVSMITSQRVLRRFRHLTHFETVYFPGMSRPLELPEYIIVEDVSTRRIQEFALARRRELEGQLGASVGEDVFSVPVRSLLLCGAIAEVLGRMDLAKLAGEIVEVTLKKEQDGQIL